VVEDGCERQYSFVNNVYKTLNNTSRKHDTLGKLAYEFHDLRDVVIILE
jgi:hypothetical protein